jgi:cell division protein FtsB
MANRRRPIVTQDRQTRIRISMSILILATLVLLFTLIFDGRGLMGHLKRKNTAKKLQTDINTIKLQNEVIKNQIDLIQNDPLEVEKIAREELGLSKPGEIIYKFESN